MPEQVPSLAPQAERLRVFAQRTVAQGPVGIQPVIIAGNLDALEYGNDPLGWALAGRQAAVVAEFSYVGVRCISGLTVVEAVIVAATVDQDFHVKLARPTGGALAVDALGLGSTNSRIVPSVRRVLDSNAAGTLGTTIVRAIVLASTSLLIPIRVVLEPNDELVVTSDGNNKVVTATMWGKVYGDSA